MPDSAKPDFWKRKLAAFLHDPPSKALDIAAHEKQARSLYSQAGFVDEEELLRLDVNFAKPSDWTAASADRLPFPKSRGNLSSVFDGVRAGFHHPLSPGGERYRFHKEFQSSAAAMEPEQSVQPCIDASGWPEPDLWRARFFAHWRLWEHRCTEKDARFALLPADTRLPDHSIWTHVQVVSALDGCAEGYGKDAVLRPAFLKFQISGVQEFIGQARSIRDLWSGSYLVSWLMAAGLKTLAWEVGPDTVVFPNLKGQPLFDLHLREDLWSKISLNGKNGWDHVQPNQRAQLTPNLPNVFLAVVPRGRAKELGELVKKAIGDEWRKIAAAVWEFTDDAGMIPELEVRFSKADRKARFDHQVKHHLSMAWQATPWPETLDGALALADSFNENMPIRQARERVLGVVEYATKTMPGADRDGRYYIGGNDGPKTKLNNIGLGWSVILASNGGQLDAVRQLRTFHAAGTGGRETGTFQNKDSLGGTVEAVTGGREWLASAEKTGGFWASLFKHDDWLGAASLIKRLWHLAYLKEKPWNLPTDSQNMPMPDTRQIALGLYDGNDSDQPPVEKASGDNYFAVLALDGDSIGEWVSGERTPPIGKQVSSYSDAEGKVAQGAKKYFSDHDGAKLLATNRPLSPSYHLQFSAALSNFALHCADRIVRHFKGQLIYSGGDDVLAMLPADQALGCARALRAAFRGTDPGVPDISSPAPGYLYFAGHEDDLKHPIPVIVPGPAADCSVGIAIAHFKSPLQDAVREARLAEKRAKKLPEKAAVAVTVMKRSGETVEWAAKWETEQPGHKGVTAAFTLLDALRDGVVSSKFPYRLAELMSVYRTKSGPMMQPMSPTAGFDLPAVFERELDTVLTRQRGPAWNEHGNEFVRKFSAEMRAWLKSMLAEHDIEHALTQLTALCAFCGFAKRLD